MDHLNLAIQRHSTTVVSTEYFGKDRSIGVSGRFLTGQKPRELPRAAFCLIQQED
jgi:hypothetical protein